MILLTKSTDQLKNGMPDNSIIDESVHLYEEEISEVLG